MKNKFVVVKALGQSQIEALSEIYVRAFRTRKEKWTKKWAARLIRSYLTKQGTAFTACVSGKPVGAFLCRVKPWWDGNRLVETELFVDPRVQKSGVGKRLFREALMSAKNKFGVSFLEGVTFARREFPMRWYKRLGIEQSSNLIFVEGRLDTIIKNLVKNKNI